MDSTPEYIQERPSLAFVVGFLAGQGVKMEWDGMVQNNDYGRKRH